MHRHSISINESKGFSDIVASIENSCQKLSFIVNRPNTQCHSVNGNISTICATIYVIAHIPSIT